MALMLSFSFAVAFLLHLLLFATAPMATLIMGEMRLSYAEFGFIFSSAMISLIVFRIPWGLMGDRRGYLLVFRIALPIIAAAALGRAFSPSYLSLLISQFLLGFGLASVLPCLPLIMKDWTSGRSLGFSTGLYVSGFASGNATALGITPLLLNLMSWRDILLLYSVLSLLLSLLWWILARTAQGEKRAALERGSFRTALKDRYVWLLLLFLIVSMGSYDTLATWMPKVLEMKGLDKALASLLPLGFFLAGPIIGWASDRLGERRKALTLLSGLAAPSIIGIHYAPFPFLLPCILLSGFAIIGMLTITLAMPAEEEHLSASIGTVVGLISSLGNIGPLVMPVVFGLLIDATGTFHASFFSVAALAAVPFILGSKGGHASTQGSMESMKHLSNSP